MSSAPERAGAEPTRSGTPRGRPWCPLLFGLTLALLAWILFESLPEPPRRPGADDRYYLHFMQTVSEEGVSAFPGLVETWNATPQDWIFPPPTRVGFVVTTALWAKLFGATYRSLQTLSLASFLLLCLLNYGFARRHLGEPRALFVGALVGFSPLLMGLSRMALSDSCVALWMTTAVWTFLELVKDPGSRAKALLFMAVLAGMVLVKELSVLLVGPFVAFLLFERLARGVPHDVRRFAVCFAVPGVVTAAVLVLAAGGLGPLWETVTIVLGSPATNRYAIRFGSGPWFRIVLDFLLVSPWPSLLAVGWFWVTAWRLGTGRYDRESVYFAIVIATIVFSLSFFTKNVRYGSALVVPVRVFAVLLVCELASRLGPRRAALLSGLAVALLCWLDWRNFELLWIDHPGYDPVTSFLGTAREMFP